MTVLLALDTETQEFNSKLGITPRNAKLEGVSVSYGLGLSEYSEVPERWPLMVPEDATVVMHKAIFDILKLAQAGLPVPKKFEDTKISAWLLNENRLTSLKPLAKELLGVEGKPYKEIDRSNADAFAEYARLDAEYTRRLWSEHFERQLKEQDLTQVYELEKAVVPVVISMEQAGMLVDRDKLGDLAKVVHEKREDARGAVFALILEAKLNGTAKSQTTTLFDLNDINLNSTAEVADLLFNTFKLKSHKKTKSGKLSVDNESLKQLNHPLADAILEFREYEKLATAFTEKLPLRIEEDGRIRPEYHQMGAATGRFSCSGPNLQQVPAHSEVGKQLRDCFIAPPGRKLIVADFSQIELRVLAHFSQDKGLKEAFELNEDLHAKTARLVFDREDVTKNERSVAKTMNFAIVYGISALGLFRRLRKLGVLGYSQSDCEDFIAAYFKAYPGVDSFLKRVEKVIKARGYVKSLYGRRRRISGKSPREIRQAQNFIIQGSAADLAKQAMVDIYARLPEGAFITAAVHDEFVVEVDEDQAESVKDMMVECMCNTPSSFRVPIAVSASVVDRWGDGK